MLRGAHPVPDSGHTLTLCAVGQVLSILLLCLQALTALHQGLASLECLGKEEKEEKIGGPEASGLPNVSTSDTEAGNNRTKTGSETESGTDMVDTSMISEASPTDTVADLGNTNITLTTAAADTNTTMTDTNTTMTDTNTAMADTNTALTNKVAVEHSTVGTNTVKTQVTDEGRAERSLSPPPFSVSPRRLSPVPNSTADVRSYLDHLPEMNLPWQPLRSVTHCACGRAFTFLVTKVSG